MYNYFEVKISSHWLVNCSVKEDCSLKEAKGKNTRNVEAYSQGKLIMRLFTEWNVSKLP